MHNQNKVIKLDCQVQSYFVINTIKAIDYIIGYYACRIKYITIASGWILLNDIFPQMIL